MEQVLRELLYFHFKKPLKNISNDLIALLKEVDAWGAPDIDVLLSYINAMKELKFFTITSIEGDIVNIGKKSMDDESELDKATLELAEKCIVLQLRYILGFKGLDKKDFIFGYLEDFLKENSIGDEGTFVFDLIFYPYMEALRKNRELVRELEMFNIDFHLQMVEMMGPE